MNGAQLLAGKRALITGASQGIGAAIAVRFAAEGAHVAVNYRSHSEESDALGVVATIAAGGGRALPVLADVSNARAVRRLVVAVVRELKGIDVLVNNAGVCIWTGFLDLRVSVWERTQSVNTKGVFLCSKFVADEMVRQGSGGSIVTIGSVGAYTGGEQQADYNASKAAAGSLMRSMAVALGPYGVRCNTVLPGCIKTAMNADKLTNAAYRASLLQRTPLGCLGTPADVAAAAVFFACDNSRFCTGAELRVDGGIGINF